MCSSKIAYIAIYRNLQVYNIAGCGYIAMVSFRPQPIMLKFLPIMLLSSAQKVTHYAQYYAHNYFNYATAQPQILLF